jgi:Fe-S oxidoreductase/nitrate reductase gamma subunit
MSSSIHPATAKVFGVTGYLLGWVLLIVGVTLFSFVLYRRFLLLRWGQADPRLSFIGKRLTDVFTIGILQIRQPRYLWAGILHILIFWGFVVLGLRSVDLVTQSLGLPIFAPLMGTSFGHFYHGVKDLFELAVLGACICAILRRAILRPERYRDSHTPEAYLVLGLISFLMVTDIFYEGSFAVLNQTSQIAPPASHLAAEALKGATPSLVKGVHLWSYWLHLVAFFFFLNYLPFGKHFHIITALPNVFFRKRSKGSVKPARWDVQDIDELDTLGVEKLEDFTWKHLLDLYACTECGRCTDQCPANQVGRPLSPKMITMDIRDYAYQRYPIFPPKADTEKPEELSVPGDIVSQDAIWSCTTCGACEEECPVCIEYIDKIIDMRRHLIETAQNPTPFNQVLMHMEKTGNPFGKPANKRADWTKDLSGRPVRILKAGDAVDLLFFVDSYGSYDPTAQAIAAAIIEGLNRLNIDFGILGPLEKDSGHQVRRMGEEGLFQLLLEDNTETLKSLRFSRIVTTDPHAFNALKNDYPQELEVLHYSMLFSTLIRDGKLKATKPVAPDDVYTFHDACYLGRHNGVYDEPRQILKAIPGLNYLEMDRSRDRSFCCGGADIGLWYEIQEERIRMSEKRIQISRDAGANVIVTACPFCLIHFEDAIKTAGLEKEMRVVDLMRLFVSVL